MEPPVAYTDALFSLSLSWRRLREASEDLCSLRPRCAVALLYTYRISLSLGNGDYIAAALRRTQERRSSLYRAADVYL